MNTSTKQWFKTMATAAALLALGTLAGTASADPIQFTVTGTADSSLYGYTAGQSYSFTWIVNSGFTNNESSRFDSTRNSWTDERVSEAPVFSALSGDGLTGSFQRPSLQEYDPYSYLDVWPTGGTTNLELYVGNDRDYSIGLQANGTDIWTIVAADLQIANIFSFPGSYTDPNDYFAGLTGTYGVLAGTIELYPVNNGAGLFFTPTSLTISAIPEPSTALLTGLGLIALVFRRRR